MLILTFVIFILLFRLMLVKTFMVILISWLVLYNIHMNIGNVILWFAIGYVGATVASTIHTGINIGVRKMGFDRKHPNKSEGFVKTQPYHPLYDIVIFTICGYFCGINTLGVAVATAGIWFLLSIALDWLFWVAIKHPSSYTYKEFYKGFQPWLTFCYVAIVAAPFVAYSLTF